MTMKPEKPKRKTLTLDLGLTDYRKALDLQDRLVRERESGELDRDLVIFLEHEKVFTLGRRGGLENVTVSEAFLAQAGVPIVHTERGGNITYHGPGQLVVYPILDLKQAGLGVAEYVDCLEEIIIRTLADWGVEAGRDARNHGVWVGNNKIGSIGISVQHNVTKHGLAMNVNLDLTPFSWINPCGMQGVGMTSMERELGRTLPDADVRATLKGRMAEILGCEFADMNISEAARLLGPEQGAEKFDNIAETAL